MTENNFESHEDQSHENTVSCLLCRKQSAMLKGERISVDLKSEQLNLLNASGSTQKHFSIRHRSKDGSETDEILGWGSNIWTALSAAQMWADLCGTEIVGICESPVQQ